MNSFVILPRLERDEGDEGATCPFKEMTMTKKDRADVKKALSKKELADTDRRAARAARRKARRERRKAEAGTTRKPRKVRTKEPVVKASAAWEQALLKKHPNCLFYVEVSNRDENVKGMNGNHQVVAYDSKSGDRYGEFDLPRRTR